MTQALNGAGDTRTPTVINFVCFWLIEIPLAYVLAEALRMKSAGALAAIPLAETYSHSSCGASSGGGNGRR